MRLVQPGAAKRVARQRLSVLFIALACSSLSVLTVSGEERSVGAGEALTLRIGFMTFSLRDKMEVDPDFLTFSNYLLEISRRSRTDLRFRRALDFELVAGNYYQIYNWLQSGEIDGALCSAFIGDRLRRHGGMEAVAEFVPEELGKGYVAVAAGGTAGVEAYDRDLLAVWQSSPSGHGPGKAELKMVSHLSSSGFIAPLLHADAFLSSRAADTVERSRFWQEFLSRVTFAFRGSEKRFTYDAAPRAEGPLVDAADQPIIIPYDALWLQASVARRSSGSTVRLPDRDNPWLMDAASYPKMEGSIYQAARTYNVDGATSFGDQIDGLLRRNPSLAARFHDWYDKERFDFTIEETARLLRDDAATTGRDDLALVLSGGGVKGAYQARLVDYLYSDKRLLTNMERQSTSPHNGVLCSAPKSQERPLLVRHIIGTSGGAIVGMMAAQITDNDCANLRLRRAWIEPDEAGQERVVASSDDIFASGDLLRWVSFWSLLFLLGTVLFLRRPAPLLSRRAGALPLGMIVVLVIAVLSAPLLLRSDLQHRESVTLGAGLLDVSVVLLAHLLWCCSGRTKVERRGAGGKQRPDPLTLLTLLAGIGSIIGGGALPSRQAAAQGMLDSVSPPVALAISGLILLLLGVLRYASLGTGSIRLRGTDAHFQAVAVCILFCGGVYLLCCLLFFNPKFMATRLEMTGPYWGVLLGVGLLAALTLAETARRRPESRIGRQVRNLITPRHTGQLGGRPLPSLLMLTGMAIGAWVAFNSTALYGNTAALAFLKEDLGHTLQRRRSTSDKVKPVPLAADQQVPLQVDFLVATSSLTPPDLVRRDAMETLSPGGWLFCFRGPSADGCRGFEAVDARVVWNASWIDMISLVFASGSPFPIFPAHHVEIPVARSVEGILRPDGVFHADLVDGGYAHQEALAAAALSGARQVLILRASPEPPLADAENDDDRRLSRLARNLPRLFDFMFSQSQELDRRIGRNLLVASLTPHADNGAFPFLMDFRPSSVLAVDKAAMEDQEQGRRIGRIEGWGRPEGIMTLRAEWPGKLLKLPAVGWDERVRRSLLRQLNDKTRPNVAVFDLDGTCLDGDMGLALLREQIRSGTYRGDLAAFWDLLDPDLRSMAKAAWDNKRHAAEPFLEQYYLVPSGARGTASRRAWLARLLGGLSPEEASSLAERAWAAEAADPAGLRVYTQMKELIQGLQALDWDVWIVGASSEFAVDVAAEKLGVAADHALGLRSQLGDDGLLAFTVEEPLPYGAEKQRLLEQNLIHPTFVAGDGPGDFAMLDAARVALYIGERLPSRDRTRARQWLLQDPASFTRAAGR